MIIRSARARQQATASALELEYYERLKCTRDPVHTMNKYFKLMDPQYGLHPMTLSDPQLRVLDKIQTSSHVITMQPRQAGLTTTLLSYLLWDAMFVPNRTNVYASAAIRMVHPCVDLVHHVLSHIPPSLGVRYLRNTWSFEFSNGSVLDLVSADNLGKNRSVDHLVLADFAHMSPIQQSLSFDSAGHMIAQRGQMIIGSTPRIAGDLFHHLWEDAEAGLNALTPVRVTWQEVIPPSKYLSLRQYVGDDVMRREYDCEFLP